MSHDTVIPVTPINPHDALREQIIRRFKDGTV